MGREGNLPNALPAMAKLTPFPAASLVPRSPKFEDDRKHKLSIMLQGQNVLQKLLDKYKGREHDFCRP